MTATLRSEPACTGGDPPQCCQPSYEDRRVMRAAQLDAVSPRCCPCCGSGRVAPLFWPDPSLDVWDCSDCAAIFSGRGD